ncbi:hypothetical protein WN51_07996 [Melipona quadrifasciata]|uniref:Uncharacterized protein n=1 Tax=Melipona quadrifasciata TaxID=166423 RepID=A0A0M8ZPS3_9HYME|nr:hypothetical protein WN51_07996 [Melipona quadrifasciata]
MNINARQALSERQNRYVLLMPAKCTQFSKSKVYKQEPHSNSCVTVTVQPPASVMVTATCRDIQASVHGRRNILSTSFATIANTKRTRLCGNTLDDDEDGKGRVEFGADEWEKKYLRMVSAISTAMTRHDSYVSTLQ